MPLTLPASVMIPNELSEAFFHESHTVLGIELQPFCLYHLLALATIDSPFIADDQPISVIDLERAVLLCSVPLPTTLKEDIAYSYKITSLFAHAPKPLAAWIVANGIKPDTLSARIAEEYEKFKKYVADFSPAPDVVIEQTGGETIGAHWILSCAANVIKFTGWSKEYVFSMAVGQIYHFSVYFAASEGAKIRFSSEREGGLIDWLNSQGIAYQP